MKILHIINNLNTGGAENIVTNIAPLIKEKQFDVDVLLLNNSSQIYKEQLLNNGINIIYTNTNKLYSPIQIFKIRKIIKNYDIVHSHLFPTQYWVALSNLFNKKTILITTEHNTHNRRRDFKIFKIIDKFIYSKYNKIISNSNETQNNLKKFIGETQNKNKYIVIENGVNLEKFKESKLIAKKDIHPSLKDTDIVIVQVARFNYEKDQKTAIKTVQLLDERFKLMLVGEGILEDECKQLVKELNLEDRVKFLGIRKDIPQIMKSSDICLVSSNIEGFGLVSIEAMASGTPLIASNVDGLNNVVSNGGILFEKGNIKELKDIIEKIATDNDFRENLIKSGLERCEVFSINNMVNKYCEVYETFKKGEY